MTTRHNVGPAVIIDAVTHRLGTDPLTALGERGRPMSDWSPDVIEAAAKAAREEWSGHTNWLAATESVRQGYRRLAAAVLDAAEAAR